MSSSTNTRNDSLNLHVTVLLLNNDPDPVLETAEIVLLAIVFLISLCGNTFLLVTILSSYSLREDTFNILLANFCATFLIETIINMSIAILYIAVDTWHLGSIGCVISSFSVQIVTMEITFSLCMACVQSMILVLHPYEFQSFWTLKKQAVAIATLWTVGILLCLPLLSKSIESAVFPSRYGCSFTGSDGFIYMLFVTIWCYGIMVAIGVGCLINLGINQYREYKAQIRKHGLNYSEAFIPGGLWSEWTNVKLSAFITLFYLILEFPYTMMHQISGLKAHTDESSIVSNSSLYSITTNSSYQNHVNTGSLKYETVLTWFRYLYSCFYACIVFKIRKDIRYKFRNLLHCCQPNVVRDHSAAPLSKQENKKKSNRKDSNHPISLSTPVLYISPEGLCLRQLAPMTKSFIQYSEKDLIAKKPNFVSYLCDVECISNNEDFISPMDETFNSVVSRRSSKESEVSLGEFGISDSIKSMSHDMPLNDLDHKVLEAPPTPPKPHESPPRKKKVRFAETLTFFRALTPKAETPTPDWVTTETAGSRSNVQTNIRSRHSKIPTRVQPTTSTPWKVELNKTYNLRSPAYQQTKRTDRNFRKTSDIGDGSQKMPLQWIFNE